MGPSRVDDSEQADINDSILSDDWIAIGESISRSGDRNLKSREAFVRSLGTFSPRTFFAKPPALSPILCASFGWKNSSCDMLECTGCGAVLCIKIPPKISFKSKAGKKLLQQYQSKLATAHCKYCPFRLEAQQCLLSESTQKSAKDYDEHHVIPIYLVRLLPPQVLNLIENPRPLKPMQQQWRALLLCFKQGDEVEGEFPHWKMPKVVVSSEIQAFRAEKYFETMRHKASNFRPTLLARLGHDVIDMVPPLLERIDKALRPHQPQDEIRAETRVMAAWADVYEAIAGLTLFGWTPCGENQINNDRLDVTLQCPLCLAQMEFSVTREDCGNRRSSQRRMTTESPGVKKQRLNQQFTEINPAIAHRHFCPYTCGFPRRISEKDVKAVPVWKILASRVLSEEETTERSENELEEDNDATTKILQILTSAIARREMDSS